MFPCEVVNAFEWCLAADAGVVSVIILGVERGDVGVFRLDGWSRSANQATKLREDVDPSVLVVAGFGVDEAGGWSLMDGVCR